MRTQLMIISNTQYEIESDGKVGISLTAVITILGSLFMSLGLTGTSVGGTGMVYRETDR